MAKVVYIAVSNSGKGAHQYVHIDGERIGEIWREQLAIEVSQGFKGKKWRWFARQDGSHLVLGAEVNHQGKSGFGSKDSAVDALETAAASKET